MNHSQNLEDSKRQAEPLDSKIKELVQKSKSFILATLDAEGTPNSSYAPFVQVENTFYILVSFLAKHTQNLVEGKKTSIMFIEDECATKQIYARERLTIDAYTSQVERNCEIWNTVVSQLKETHGKVVEVISEMNDFILIGIHPVKGSYVNGFGSAYFVDENLEISQYRNNQNHQAK